MEASITNAENKDFDKVGEIRDIKRPFKEFVESNHYIITASYMFLPTINLAQNKKINSG